MKYWYSDKQNKVEGFVYLSDRCKPSASQVDDFENDRTAEQIGLDLAHEMGLIEKELKIEDTLQGFARTEGQLIALRDFPHKNRVTSKKLVTFEGEGCLRIKTSDNRSYLMLPDGSFTEDYGEKSATEVQQLLLAANEAIKRWQFSYNPETGLITGEGQELYGRVPRLEITASAVRSLDHLRELAFAAVSGGN